MWLTSTTRQLFDDVIKARVAALVIEGARLKVNLDDKQAGAAVAEQKFLEARRYQECLNVLDEMAAQADRHSTAKIEIA